MIERAEVVQVDLGMVGRVRHADGDVAVARTVWAASAGFQKNAPASAPLAATVSPSAAPRGSGATFRN